MSAIARSSTRDEPRRRGHFSFPAALFVHMAALLFLLGAAGCSSVAAYERGKLAHPTMSPTHAGSPAREHIYAVQEGAMGGADQAASGCGCN